jgi:hypothetical protein
MLASSNKEVMNVSELGAASYNLDMTHISAGAETEHAAVERKKIIEWISLLNFFQQHDDISHARQNGTGLWLFEEARFEDWVSRTGATLWCYGMRGWLFSSNLLTLIQYSRGRENGAFVSTFLWLRIFIQPPIDQPLSIIFGRRLRARMSGLPAHT